MSGKQTGIVWELDLPLPQKIVLLAMADHADQNGDNVHPSIGLIAWKSGYSPRHVQRIINTLEKAELIVLNEKDFGKYHTVDYSLNLGKAKRLPEYKGRGSLVKDEKAVATGRKAKATRAAKVSPCDTIVSHPPMTSDVTPPMTSGCHTNGSGTVVKTVVSTGASKNDALPPTPPITFDDLRRAGDEPAQPAKDAAIQIFKEVRGKFPPKETYAQIEEVVGCEPVSLDFWRKVLVKYAALGWNRQSVSGPLEWFNKRELPHVERKNGGGKAHIRENPGVAFAKRHGLMEDSDGESGDGIEGVCTVIDDLSLARVGQLGRAGSTA